MDTKKIGSFLKTLRKEKGLSQEKLGELICTTNKTISRWENGNYMPSIDGLKLLSDIYNVSINEILSGRRLSEEEIKKASEENISSALEMGKLSINGIEKRLYIIGIVTTLISIGIILALPKTNLSILIIILVTILYSLSNVSIIVAIALLHENRN